jgi:hypothetical protein
MALGSRRGTTLYVFCMNKDIRRGEVRTEGLKNREKGGRENLSAHTIGVGDENERLEYLSRARYPLPRTEGGFISFEYLLAS